MQDELAVDGLLLGVARAEPYLETERLIEERRARGLFGDLRFTLTNTPRSCHPERLVRGARSVVAAAMPLWRPGRRPAGRPCRPHAALRLERSLRAAARAPERRSPTACARAARAARCSSTRITTSTATPRCAPASRSRHATRWRSSPGEGSFVALGAIVTDAELEPAEELVPPGCGSCTLCLDACPTDALIEPGVLDATRCLSTTTQARGPVPETTRRRSRTGSTAATSARTSARGTPARPAPAPTCRPRSGRLGLAGRLARAAGRRAAGAATRASTCPTRSALPAAQRARRARQRAGEQRASWRGRTPTSGDRCCGRRAPRPRATASDEGADLFASARSSTRCRRGRRGRRRRGSRRPRWPARDGAARRRRASGRPARRVRRQPSKCPAAVASAGRRRRRAAGRPHGRLRPDRVGVVDRQHEGVGAEGRRARPGRPPPRSGSP